MSEEDNAIASDGCLAIEFGHWAEDRLSHFIDDFTVSVRGKLSCKRPEST